MFIELEGVDASGKATQSKALAEVLGAKHYSFPDYKTPMGALIGEMLAEHWWTDFGSELALEKIEFPISAMVLQSLMLTNRMEHAVEIKKACELGHVVCDRYWHSAYAYGQTDGIDGEYLTLIHANLPQPDFHIYLEVSEESQKSRILARGRTLDRYEKTAGLMDKVAINYRTLWLSKQDKVRNATGWWKWAIVDGNGTREEVSKRVFDAVLESATHEWDHAPVLEDRVKLVGLQQAMLKALQEV